MLTQCFKLVFFHLGRTIAKKCITAYFLFHLGKKQYSKSAGKMKKTDFFPQKSGFRQSWAKSLGQYCNIHIFLSFLGSLINSASFSKFCCSSPSPPHPIQNWNSEKILDTRVQHCLWGEGRGWTNKIKYVSIKYVFKTIIS